MLNSQSNNFSYLSYNPILLLSKMPGKSALVFGATGVSGWALVNEILHDYPDKGIWNRVHALCNRPLDLSRSFWPDDKRLNIVPGVDLLQGNQAELEAKIASRIPEVENITHVYYLGELVATSSCCRDFRAKLSKPIRQTLRIYNAKPRMPKLWSAVQ